MQKPNTENAVIVEVAPGLYKAYAVQAVTTQHSSVKDVAGSLEKHGWSWVEELPSVKGIAPKPDLGEVKIVRLGLAWYMCNGVAMVTYRDRYYAVNGTCPRDWMAVTPDGRIVLGKNCVPLIYRFPEDLARVVEKMGYTPVKHFSSEQEGWTPDDGWS